MQQNCKIIFKPGFPPSLTLFIGKVKMATDGALCSHVTARESAKWKLTSNSDKVIELRGVLPHANLVDQAFSPSLNCQINC